MTSECKTCGDRVKLLGKTGECFKCNQTEFYNAYPAGDKNKGKVRK